MTVTGTGRWIRATLAFAIVLSLFAGCGDAGNAHPTASPTTAAHLLAPTPTVAGDETALALDLIPNAAAPDGLGSLTLPTSVEDIAALFAQLPEFALESQRIMVDVDTGGLDAAWHPRCASDCWHVASYGSQELDAEPLIVGAINAINIIGISDFYPRDWGGGHVIADNFILKRQLDSQMSPGIAVTPPPLPDPNDGFAVGTWRDGTLIWERSVYQVHSPGENETSLMYTVRFGALDNPWLFEVSADGPDAASELLTVFVEVVTSSR